MAKQRIVNTKFWDDSYIAGLSQIEKLLFLYLITNPLTNISGVYELPVKRVAFDTGIEIGKIEEIFHKLEKDEKLVVLNGWVGIVNFIKYQTLNPKIKQGILAELKKAPKGITDKLSIDYQTFCTPYDSLSHLNSNLNKNPNSNALPLREKSTEYPQYVERKRSELVSKWKV